MTTRFSKLLIQFGISSLGLLATSLLGNEGKPEKSPLLWNFEGSQNQFVPIQEVLNPKKTPPQFLDLSIDSDEDSFAEMSPEEESSPEPSATGPSSETTPTKAHEKKFSSNVPSSPEADEESLVTKNGSSQTSTLSEEPHLSKTSSNPVEHTQTPVVVDENITSKKDQKSPNAQEVYRQKGQTQTQYPSETIFDFKRDAASKLLPQNGTASLNEKTSNRSPLISEKNTNPLSNVETESKDASIADFPLSDSVKKRSIEKDKTAPTSSTQRQQSLSAAKAPFLQTRNRRPKRVTVKAQELEKDKKKSEEEIAQSPDEDAPLPVETGQMQTPPKTILINFNNVGVIEYIRFISRIANRNFIFDESDLQFNVTIISEEPTTLENVITALIQELRIHGLELIEEGNNFIIHQNPQVRSISRVSVDGVPEESPKETEIVTQVFRLNTLDPSQAQSILSPMLSDNAIISVAEETRHIVVTDLVQNIRQIETLLKSMDAPNSGMVLGQYVVRNAFMDNLIELATKIMAPIAKGQNLTFVPHPASGSIFIVASPFLVERTISVLQHLDSFQATTRIYDLEDLKFQQIRPLRPPPPVAPELTRPEGLPPESVTPTPGVPRGEAVSSEEEAPPGRWELSPRGVWIFRPGFVPGKAISPDELPRGQWLLDDQGNWYFAPEGTKLPFEERPDERPKPVPTGESPRGRWTLDPQATWIFQLTPGEEIRPAKLFRAQKLLEDLPLGHVERTKFFIHKLQFRRGEDIVFALQGIAQSLQFQGTANEDLIAAIQSAQWLELSNSIIVTGTESAIAKVKELIEEIDAPLREVLIEMLILETTISDSLTYGVSWATKSGGGNTATAQAFVGLASPLISALATSGITDGIVDIPSAENVIGTIGYNLGIIGQRITHNGTQFASLGALVQAVHTRADTDVVINPKIIVEDNKTAEIFVGINSPFLSNSIANDEGSIITTNVEFRDSGVTLRVTPLISHGNIITLEIEQEVSRVQGMPQDMQQANLTPTTSINRTTTTIHVPDRHFVVLSGMLQDEKIGNNNQFPCLGGIPIIGAAFRIRDESDAKRNLMIFIKPEIIDTSEQFRDITRRQQKIWEQKNRMKKSWKYEVDQALEFLNIKPPCCDECE